MELKDYTTEQLKAELKRRYEAKKQESLSVPRCRNCKHFVEEQMNWWVKQTCSVRTFIQKGKEHHYIVKPSNKACNQYERKED